MKNPRRNELGEVVPVAARPGAPGYVGLNDCQADRTAGIPTGSVSAQRVCSRVRAAGGAIATLCFPLVHLIVRAAVRVCFERIETIGRERFPRRGPVLVVANHPAAWTDVVVLEVALERRLHFIAHQALFRPRIRGLLLELFAALPVWRREEDPESVAHNLETFERCHAAFRTGQAVAMFPEGVSGGDRDLLPLKTGAARLLLHGSREGSGSPRLVPVAIRYQDRTAFRTAVVVAVGAPIAYPAPPPGVGEADRATLALSDDIARGLGASLVAAGARAGARAQARSSPPGLMEPLAEAGAALGMALHAVPLAAIQLAAHRLANHPQQISFGRMAAGLLLIPLWYGLLVMLARALGGGAWYALPITAPWLGVLACRAHDRRRSVGEAVP